jgi:hypothetical protein
MNETSKENDDVERLLRRARLPEPSAELKERVTSAARRAWDQAAPDIPWQVPVRRLGVAAAAAMLMVTLANYCGDSVPADRQSHGFTTTTEEPPDLGDWLQPYSPIARHLAMTSKSPRNPAALLEYMAKVREFLGEDEHGEAPDAATPVERRSRLPARLNFYS